MIMSSAVRVRKIRLGDDVPAYCGRCKAERTHQVIALNPDGVPATVTCRTCDGQHRFREKKEGAAHAQRGLIVRRSGAKQTEATRAAMARAVSHNSPQETYSKGEWIDHPKFGRGEVMGSRNGKIEVRFGAETRLFVHAV